ncbi:MAG: amidohydrolase family protein [Siphonobacter sp.]
MKKILFTILAFSAFLKASYAQNEAAAKPQTSPVALTGGTIHVGNGQVIENGTIIFDKGVITYVGTSSASLPSGTQSITVTGKHIYPGLISPANQLGLVEISAVRATNDDAEVGEYTPNVRALIAYNTDSEVIPTVRGNGVLLTQATPVGGIISGMSSVMQLDGWNWEDAVLKKDDGVHLSWPSYFRRGFNFDAGSASTVKNDRREEQFRELDKIFNDAIAYSQATGATVNMKLEAMKGLFDGSKNLYVTADYGKEIIEAVRFAKAKGVRKIVIISGEESLMAADFLKENNIPIIVNTTHRLPNHTDDDTDLPYKLPYLLTQKGLTVGLGYIGLNWRTRNLPFLAGTVGGHGMTSEEALKLVTSNNAKILGIDQWVGTLEKGKHATLVVSVGDILDMRTAKVEQAFIQGKSLNLDDKQKRLYRTFTEKYDRQSKK